MIAEPKTVKLEVCAHCGRPLPRDERGRVSYWTEMRPGTGGWPISVKVCRDCRYQWPREEDAK